MRMRTGISRPMIFVVISALVVVSVYSSYSGFEAFAVPPDHRRWSGNCEEIVDKNLDLDHVRCCWEELDILDPEGEPIVWCQTCDDKTSPPSDCSEIHIKTPSPMGPVGVLPQDGVLQQPLPPPSGPAAPLQDGVLEQEQPSAPSQPEVDCRTNLTHPSCQATEITPQVDCTQIPDDPLCETVSIPEAEEQQQPQAEEQEQIREGGILTQPTVPTNEVAENKVCDTGPTASGGCVPQPKCPAGTSPVPGTGGDCAPVPAARELPPQAEIPPATSELEAELNEEPQAEEEQQPTEEEDGSEDNSNN